MGRCVWLGIWRLIRIEGTTADYQFSTLKSAIEISGRFGLTRMVNDLPLVYFAQYASAELVKRKGFTKVSEKPF